MNKFNETVNSLTEFIDLIGKLIFGSKTAWKPFQKGIVITTTSFLELSNFLINERGYRFVLGGRFT